MTLTLYAHPLSSYCQKVLTALYENGTPFDFAMLDGSDPVANAFAALSPVGKFPVMTDGERVVAEATIIIEYLDVHCPGATRFLPDDKAAAIEIRWMDRFFDNYLQTPFQRIVGMAIGLEQGDEAKLRGQLDTAYRWLDGWLAGRKWAAGDTFSLADCSAAPALLYADWTHAIPREYANIWTYRDRLLARPSYARALDEARPYRHLYPLGAPEGRD